MAAMLDDTTIEAHKKSFVDCHPTWPPWHSIGNVHTTRAWNPIEFHVRVRLKLNFCLISQMVTFSMIAVYHFKTIYITIIIYI